MFNNKLRLYNHSSLFEAQQHRRLSLGNRIVTRPKSHSLRGRHGGRAPLCTFLILREKIEFPVSRADLKLRTLFDDSTKDDMITDCCIVPVK